jgi:hypothetical protein
VSVLMNSSDDSLPAVSSSPARPVPLVLRALSSVPLAASIFGAALACVRRAPDAITLCADGPAVAYGDLVGHAHRACADLWGASITPLIRRRQSSPRQVKR